MTFSVGPNKITGIEDKRNNTKALYVSDGYPNPFNNSIKLNFLLPNPDQITILVYDAIGKEICNLQIGFYPKGSHQIGWDGKDSAGKSVSSGIYFILLKAEFFQRIIKVAYVR